MACGCKQKIATLRCTACGSHVQLSYELGQDILALAREKGTQCRKCKATEFEVKK